MKNIQLLRKYVLSVYVYARKWHYEQPNRALNLVGESGSELISNSED